MYYLIFSVTVNHQVHFKLLSNVLQEWIEFYMLPEWAFWNFCGCQSSKRQYFKQWCFLFLPFFFFFKSDTRSFGLCSSGSAATRRWCQLSSSPCTLAISPETLSRCSEYHWYGLEWISWKFYVSECHVSFLCFLSYLFFLDSHLIHFKRGWIWKWVNFFFPAVFFPAHLLQVCLLKACWTVIKDLFWKGG